MVRSVDPRGRSLTNFAVVPWIREKLDERLPHPRRDVHDNVPAVKLAWMREPARVRDHLQIPFESERVVADSHALVRGIETGLQPLILRRHTSRARVRVAAHRLDTADRKQEPAADMYEVGAEGDMRGDLATRRDGEWDTPMPKRFCGR